MILWFLVDLIYKGIFGGGRQLWALIPQVNFHSDFCQIRCQPLFLTQSDYSASARVSWVRGIRYCGYHQKDIDDHLAAISPPSVEPESALCTVWLRGLNSSDIALWGSEASPDREQSRAGARTASHYFIRLVYFKNAYIKCLLVIKLQRFHGKIFAIEN